VLAGGARMFELGDMDIGARNAEAVAEGLARSGVTVRATDTGGNRGRTMRVTVGEFMVRVKEAGGQLTTLFDADGGAQPESERSAR
jgi:chemotaxis protein CheD